MSPEFCFLENMIKIVSSNFVDSDELDEEHVSSKRAGLLSRSSTYQSRDQSNTQTDVHTDIHTPWDFLASRQAIHFKFNFLPPKKLLCIRGNNIIVFGTVGVITSLHIKSCLCVYVWACLILTC